MSTLVGKEGTAQCDCHLLLCPIFVLFTTLPLGARGGLKYLNVALPINCFLNQNEGSGTHLCIIYIHMYQIHTHTYHIHTECPIGLERVIEIC